VSESAAKSDFLSRNAGTTEEEYRSNSATEDDLLSGRDGTDSSKVAYSYETSYPDLPKLGSRIRLPSTFGDEPAHDPKPLFIISKCR
jgi:hypothetical protein